MRAGIRIGFEVKVRIKLHIGIRWGLVRFGVTVGGRIGITAATNPNSMLYHIPPPPLYPAAIGINPAIRVVSRVRKRIRV